ncbi:hypothetical protein WN51_08769 [Melipona quadrifasciata]|uniref:Uncharacterized protein n=1 Tax=Melipona quadrifasciata TaxID=166423 RepID=A0A0M8ZPQ5_9HYME|nr:hypothetical protein WN51_08769 [Melipona quadrifasciata]
MKFLVYRNGQALSQLTDLSEKVCIPNVGELSISLPIKLHVIHVQLITLHYRKQSSVTQPGDKNRKNHAVPKEKKNPTRPRIPQLRDSNTDEHKPQVATRLALRSCQSPTLKKAECGNTAKMCAPTSLAGSYDTSVWGKESLPSAPPLRSLVSDSETKCNRLSSHTLLLSFPTASRVFKYIRVPSRYYCREYNPDCCINILTTCTQVRKSSKISHGPDLKHHQGQKSQIGRYFIQIIISQRYLKDDTLFKSFLKDIAVLSANCDEEVPKCFCVAGNSNPAILWADERKFIFDEKRGGKVNESVSKTLTGYHND